MARPRLFPKPPTVRFCPSQRECERCGTRLKVQKTIRRKVVTRHIGMFNAVESVGACPRCSDQRVYRSEELAKLVPPCCNFGYDIMTFVGRALFLEQRTVEQTIQTMAHENVTISASEVRHLAARFVVSLAIAHAQAAPAIRRHLSMQGGYILHIDSTSRLNSVKLMSGIDELSGFVLLNVKLTHETAKDIEPFLRSIIDRFGKPLALAADMAASIRCARLTIMKEVPLYICHFHFLRDAGKDLMGDDYRQLTDLLGKLKIKTKLQRLHQKLEARLDEQSSEIGSFLEALEPERGKALSPAAMLGLLCASALLADRTGDGLGFPFDRPQLAFVRQIESVTKEVRRLLHELKLDPADKRLYKRALDILQPLERNAALSRLTKRIREKCDIFDTLRNAMKLGLPGTGKGLNDEGQPLDNESLTRAVGQIKANLQRMLSTSSTDFSPELQKLVEQIDRHWDGLFRPSITVRDAAGSERVIQPQRTNNILEHFFRKLGHDERRRTGTNLSAKRLNSMLPDAPLTANLLRPRYLEIILGECKDLEERFAQIDQQLVRQSLEEARRIAKPALKPSKAHSILAKPFAPSKIAAATVYAQQQALPQPIDKNP